MCGAFETSLFDLKRRKLISKKKSIANHKCQKAKKRKAAISHIHWENRKHNKLKQGTSLPGLQGVTTVIKSIRVNKSG